MVFSYIVIIFRSPKSDESFCSFFYRLNYFALHKFGHRRQFETKMELNQQILNAKA